jgi:hypothetical protein
MDQKPYEPPAFAEHFAEAPPPILYHYTGQAGLLGIVKNSQLWATKVQYMNDTTEFGLALSMMRRELENINSDSQHSPESEKAAAVQLQSSLAGLEDINICAACFCKNGDLLSQWRGYAGGGHGYAIGFDVDVLMQIADRSEFILGRCIYERETQQDIVRQVVAHCIRNEMDFGDEAMGVSRPLADLLFRYGVFFKDPSFRDEEEWRLVSYTISYDDKQLKFRTGSSMLTPFYALSITHEDGLPIRRIIVGPCPHMELARSAVTSLLMSYGITGPLNDQEIAFASTIPFRNW